MNKNTETLSVGVNTDTNRNTYYQTIKSMIQKDLIKKCTPKELLLLGDDLSCKNQIRFRDINIDWWGMGITEEEFNEQRFIKDKNKRIYYSDGRMFVYNSILCRDNELVEWCLININDFTEFEVWEDCGGDNGYDQTILYEYFGIIVESFRVEFVSLNEFEKIDLEKVLLLNQLGTEKSI